MEKNFRSLQTKLVLIMLLCILVAIAILVVLYFADNQYKEYVFLAALITATVILFLFWSYVRRNITKPIAIIIKSLETGDIDILKTIQSDRLDTEWDYLIRLVKDDFEKTQRLKDQAKELEDAIATKDKFFDLIAHDLKSPFNAIMGFSNVMIEDYSNYSDEDKKHFLNIIFESSWNAHNLLEKLLEWARLQTGRWTPNFCKFDLSKTISNVASFHQANASQNKINLINNTRVSVFVNADENMIETVLRNLVSNAIKFTSPGGFVMIDSQEKDKEMLVTVTDNGMGIQSVIVDSLFKIGENVIQEDTAGKKGSGLGLILCKHLIEKNGGKIWLESELGKGSKFHFTVPLN